MNIRPTEIDKAMLAAFIDGEGSIAIHYQKAKDGGEFGTYHLRIFVCNTDPRLIQWCKDIFGASYSSYENGGRAKKRLFRWWCYGDKASEVLKMCLPYFILKRKEAELAIFFQDCLMSERKHRLSESDFIQRKTVQQVLVRQRNKYKIPGIPEPAISGKESKYVQ